MTHVLPSWIASLKHDELVDPATMGRIGPFIALVAQGARRIATAQDSRAHVREEAWRCRITDRARGSNDGARAGGEDRVGKPPRRMKRGRRRPGLACREDHDRVAREL